MADAAGRSRGDWEDVRKMTTRVRGGDEHWSSKARGTPGDTGGRAGHSGDSAPPHMTRTLWEGTSRQIGRLDQELFGRARVERQVRIDLTGCGGTFGAQSRLSGGR